MTEIDELKQATKELAAANAARAKETDNRIDKMFERIESLDKWRWQIIGGAAGISAVIGLAFKFLH